LSGYCSPRCVRWPPPALDRGQESTSGGFSSSSRGRLTAAWHQPHGKAGVPLPIFPGHARMLPVQRFHAFLTSPSSHTLLLPVTEAPKIGPEMIQRICRNAVQIPEPVRDCSGSFFPAWMLICFDGLSCSLFAMSSLRASVEPIRCSKFADTRFLAPDDHSIPPGYMRRCD
jgi:hypothetical protein